MSYLHRRGASSPVVATMLLAATVVAATLLAAAPTSSAHAAAGAQRAVAGYEVVAHRGYATPRITENTLEAFAEAVATGAPAVELDVRLTKDRRFVVMHDRKLNRTTTCSGAVATRTMAYIRKRCRGVRGSERIPGLPQVLRWASSVDVRLLLDIKPPVEAWTDADYTQVTTLVADRGPADRIGWLSTNARHLHRVRAADPAARVHAIARTREQVESHRTWADAVHVLTADLDPELVTSLRRQGLAVMGRNTNEPADWARLRELGVDGLLTDRLAPYFLWEAEPATPTA